jgi:glycosyltransferase involved in cell wall biosynthesis
MGGKIYYLCAEKKQDYYKLLVKFFRGHPEYQVVHTHTHARMGIVLKAAKHCGVSCRIAHSHNARNDLPKVAAFIKGLTGIPIERNANYFFACSLNAAKWLFPHRVKECKILYNGIRPQDYLFDEKKREKVRKNLGISDEAFVMIHVGRFAKQKNHEYLVKILESYQKQDSSDWQILLVGEGPLEDSIKEKVKAAGLEAHVRFLGSRKDVNELYSAADLFVFPSAYEGLGIVVIEAQASGLPCIVSAAVPEEADMEVGLLHTLCLQDEPEKWVHYMMNCRVDLSKRTGRTKSVLEGKYNIKLIAAQMQQFYPEHSI